MVTIVDDKNLGFSLGAVDYLTKPIEWPRLHEVLARYREHADNNDVLVIEDNPDTREMFTRNLEKEGWTVRTAENGREGLQRMNDALPALILLDLMMPEMDGFEFMEAFREHPDWRGIPVIVVTAKELSEEDRNRLNGQVTLIMEKGHFHKDELLKEIQQLISMQTQN
jgi:CheY-like chemotaxis protein